MPTPDPHRLPRLAAIVACALVLAPPAGAAAGPPRDQHIVVLQPGADPERVAARHRARHGAAVRRVYGRALRGYVARIPAGRLDEVRSDPSVAYVERDAEVRAHATQASPPWGLDRIDQRGLPLSASYTYAATGAGVRAYVIDTGIRSGHQDFGGRVTAGYTAIADGRGTEDCDGHGTHVAGTVGGTTYGVAKAVTLVPVRVLDCDGYGTTSGVIAGVDWVSAQTTRPAVANMSLGGDPSRALDTAVRSSIAGGVAYVLAAGNEGTDACGSSPGRVADGLTIAATTKSDAKPTWSNYGDCVDWFAPGASITSAYHTGNTASATMSGTSMAAPHTAGAAALVLEGEPAATPAQVRSALATALTPGVVTSSSTASNHLLFLDGASVLPPADGSPTASFTHSCDELTCSFDASASAPAGDGTITSYAWAFGDGTKAAGTVPSHAYLVDGTYTVTLTVTDDAGATGTATRTVTVASTPSPSSTTKEDGDTTEPPAVEETEPAGPAEETATVQPEPEPGTVPTTDDALVTTTLRPTGRRIAAGRIFRGRGALARLRRRDGARLDIAARRRGRARRAALSVTTTVAPEQRAAARRLAVHVDTNVTRRRARIALRLYDWSRQRFVTVATARNATVNDLRLSWEGTNGVRAYVSGTGEVRARLGVSHRRSFRMRTDRVRFVVGS